MIKIINPATLFRRQKTATTEAFAAITEVRDRRLSLLADREHIANAPIPLADAMGAIDQWIDENAAAFDVSFAGLVYPQFRSQPGFSFPVRPGERGLDSSPAVGQLLGLVIATNRSAVRELIVRQLSDTLEGRETIGAADRERRLAEIDAEIEAVERVEERLVRDAEAAGLPILRRDDARPEIVLLAEASLAA